MGEWANLESEAAKKAMIAFFRVHSRSFAIE